jgi:hypothetical protein
MENSMISNFRNELIFGKKKLLLLLLWKLTLGCGTTEKTSPTYLHPIFFWGNLVPKNLEPCELCEQRNILFLLAMK